MSTDRPPIPRAWLPIALGIALMLGTYLGRGLDRDEPIWNVQGPAFLPTGQVLSSVLDRIDRMYVDPVDRSRLTEVAIDAILEELDPHSYWFSAEELAAMGRRGRRKAEKKTLSDGSVVYESELRTIPYDLGMPAEEQQRLTALIDSLVEDVDAPPRVTRVIREQVIEAGKPIVPGLLSKMATLVEEMPSRPDQDEDDRIRLNFIHEALRDITGYETTFVVSEAMGGTQERIKSGLKQWFAWYDRKYKRFDGLEEAGDPLMDDPDLAPKTKEEMREYNRALREQMEEERSRKNG